MSEEAGLCWSGSDEVHVHVQGCSCSSALGGCWAITALLGTICTDSLMLGSGDLQDHRKTLLSWGALKASTDPPWCSSWAQYYFNLSGRRWFPNTPGLSGYSLAKFTSWMFWWGDKMCLLLMPPAPRSYLGRCGWTAAQWASTPELAEPPKLFGTKQGSWVVFLATLQMVLWYFLHLPEPLWTSAVHTKSHS